MPHVLVVITIMTISNSVTTETRFQEFDTRAACEAAKSGITEWSTTFKGPMGRQVFAECYPKG